MRVHRETVPREVTGRSRSAPGARLYLSRLGDGYLQTVRAAFEWIGIRRLLRAGARVFVKPNLTFPVYRKGVMTSPACVEAVVAALKDYTDTIVVGEADSGGYNRFAIDRVLESTGLRNLEKRYGVRVVNLSRLPSRPIVVTSGHLHLQVPLPSLLLDETDLIVTVPVPKLHMNTVVSLALKNQWGCIPEPHIRLRLHPYFESVITAINERLQPAVAVVDGRYGLNASGPMRGAIEDLGWLLVSDNLYGAERACVRLMGLEPDMIPLLRHLREHTNRLPEEGEIEWSTDPRPFVKSTFVLKRAWTDYPGLWAFRSRFLTWLAYYSPLAGFLHWLLYLVREPFYDYEDPDQTRA